MTPLSLFELNRMVSEVLALSLNDSYWVVAEIASLNEHPSGHCYLELVEKEASSRASIFSGGGKFRAQARATIWRTNWAKIQPKFYQETHQYLAKGMKVLLQVKVTFHEVFGYSLNVSDIDPTYTMGDMQRKRQEIVKQLMDDGVYTLNKELPLPRPLQRIAVISAAGAAGYGDFCNQLDESGFRFSTKLFAASMQGSEVESSIIAALDRIADETPQWDCVVIIRGGGAVADLNGFESYLLAANVAQFPLPILTGIGHERDDTVIDLVAHTRLKTPTAVAQFLIDKIREEYEEIERFELLIKEAVKDVMTRQKVRFENLARRYEHQATGYAQRQKERLLRLSSKLEHECKQHLLLQHQHLATLSYRLQPAARRIFERHEQHLEHLEHAIQLAGPERILKMGYSITTDEQGNLLHSAQNIKKGTLIKTILADGEITSRTI